MRIREPFKLVAVGMIGFWLIAFALLPNLLVVIASVLERGSDEFVAFALTLDSYRRLFDPLYLGVLLDSLWLAGATTVLCLLLGYPFAYLLTRMPARWRILRCWPRFAGSTGKTAPWRRGQADFLRVATFQPRRFPP